MSDNFDELPCGYVSFRDDGIIEHCNESLISWVGWTREELVGKSVENIFTLATRIFYNTHFFPLIKLHGKANEIFFSLKSKDAGDVAVLANANRRKDAKGDLIRCIFVQVQERKKYEQELLNAKRAAEQALTENKQLTELTRSLEEQAIKLDQQYHKQVLINENLLQFSKIISHDFQEPIRKIRMFADLISQRITNNDAQLKTYCVKIDSSAEKLNMLTTGLQQYVLIDTEKHHTTVNLNDVVLSAKARATDARGFSDFSFKTDLLPEIQGYKSQLELLFYHLTDNAIQFRHPERRLEIGIESITLSENIFRVAKDKYKYMEHVRIKFSDNGIGIPGQYTNYIFELLKKMDGSGKGLGLGLSLAKKIVENHSGSIEVVSASESGTAFEIVLPLLIQS